ncbi:MAG TPA: fumarylacetoacetate hydrolase family protein [Blastocatellia bacterium]|nr:fumarylacetoacetate hydrolase family protein [Blastocatellia bacterium]
MKQEEIQAAAALLWQHWNRSTRIAELPADCRPGDRAEGYEIQAALAGLSGQGVAGWKIAATSLAGQAHIGVDGPLAGRLLAQRMLKDGAAISLGGNLMRVAEAEFAFRFGRPLPKRAEPYDVEEVLEAVESLHPAIEIPDSRYHDFARVGAAQLIADNACACWFILGAATRIEWRGLDLARHRVAVSRNGAPAADGIGSNVLGDPRLALTWIANELRVFGEGLRAGEVVTTGTCIKPVPIEPGDSVHADFGAIGTIEAAFS